jgi:hypothetical protein
MSQGPGGRAGRSTYVAKGSSKLELLMITFRGGRESSESSILGNFYLLYLIFLKKKLEPEVEDVIFLHFYFFQFLFL